MKNLFKKAQRDNKDPWFSLLDYHNTPTTGMQTSPAQCLMSRRTKTLVPISTNLIFPEVPDGVQNQLQWKCQMAKSYHDRNVKVLLDLEIGQEVRLAPLQRGRPWKGGTCVEKLSDRSYMVKADRELFWRNRYDLKPTKENPPAQNQNLYHSQLWRAMQLQQLLLLQAQQYKEQAPETLSCQQDLQTTFAKKKNFTLQLNFIRLFYIL